MEIPAHIDLAGIAIALGLTAMVAALAWAITVTTEPGDRP